MKLDGRTLLEHGIENIIASGVATTIVVVAPEAYLSATKDMIKKVSAASETPISIDVVAGGADRVESVRNGVRRSAGADFILVHDAARALTPPDVFRRVVKALEMGAEAVVPVVPMVDTVRRAVDVEDAGGAGGDSGAGSAASEVHEILKGDLDRSALRRIQTPQGFTSAVLNRAHDDFERALAAADRDGITSEASGMEATDDAGLVERLGVDVMAVPGDERALKITYPLDLVVAEHLVREQQNATPGEPR